VDECKPLEVGQLSVDILKATELPKPVTTFAAGAYTRSLFSST